MISADCRTSKTNQTCTAGCGRSVLYDHYRRGDCSEAISVKLNPTKKGSEEKNVHSRNI